ncbi:DUF6580 family putative transport protein [Chondromyces apiculatus]|uniref:Biotin transporter n=1 Tax=Chondromyces apiculatus DSM 436 TaxID=1192034 RepID=A0A017STT2_9BACT|nr:DUF6580 family putative transport protein [Chondromyces apiculatus]EYF00172.1 Hypothetical protein CAP_1107 [Chondromyces apiculatus DSM 436]
MLPALLIVLCVVLRVVPHPPNFAPVGATAVFAGRTLKPWMALSLIIAAMLVGDVILASLHGYPPVSLVTPFVYGGFFVQALLGRALRSTKGGAVGAALGGSIAFFALSNLGVWAARSLYPHTAAGLGACYVAALPFLGGTLLGDLVWTLILSAAYRPMAARLESRPLWVPVSTKELAAV